MMTTAAMMAEARLVSASSSGLVPWENSRPYFPELDGVRAVAALMVMAFHFSQAWWRRGFMMFGQTGVDLFFVLSGFLITTILLQARPENWAELRRFYVRRTLRIFPLYYGFLAFYGIMWGVSSWYLFYGQNFAAGLGYPLQGPEHFWSLAVEEQFYLIWPFFILFWPRRWLAFGMWGAYVLLLVSRLAAVQTPYVSLALTLTRPDGLVAGGLLAYYHGKGRLGRARPMLVGVASGSVWILLVEHMVLAGRGVLWTEATKYTLASIAYVALIGLLLMTRESLVHRVLRSVPMRGVGRVSYGLYVYHPVVFALLPPHLGAEPLWLKAILCLLVSYALSFASYHSFEKRFISLKDKFALEKRFCDVKVSGVRSIYSERCAACLRVCD